MGSRGLQMAVLLIAMVFAPQSVFGTETPAGLPATPGIGGGDILSLGLSLIVVVGVILALGWFYSRSRFVSGGGADLITIVATRPLGPKERLMVVEIAAGIVFGSMALLHVFSNACQRLAITTSARGRTATCIG